MCCTSAGTGACNVEPMEVIGNIRSDIALIQCGGRQTLSTTSTGSIEIWKLESEIKDLPNRDEHLWRDVVNRISAATAK